MTTIPETTNEPTEFERLCIVTRQNINRKKGLRFVASPDGVCVFDVNAKLPGRGVWVSADRACLSQAIKTGAFSRGLKQNVTLMPDTEDFVEKILLKKCQSQISFAKKSGVLVQGYSAIENFYDRASSHALACLVQASNGDNSTRRSLSSALLKAQPNLHWAGALSGEELGASTGKPFVAHALIRAGKLAQDWILAYERLIGFRDGPEIAWKIELNPINSNLAAAK